MQAVILDSTDNLRPEKCVKRNRTTLIPSGSRILGIRLLLSGLAGAPRPGSGAHLVSRLLGMVAK